MAGGVHFSYLLQTSRARCRVRTCTTPAEHQALTAADSQIDSQKIRNSSELIEVIRAWAGLSEPLRAAVLAIVRSHALSRQEDSE